ncbi:MAG: hypothetical protein M1825_001782 [Sarcosagium campestre]|nr:MAG: hypothetical protein M1825_001782 [Sarcosagium campestre]
MRDRFTRTPHTAHPHTPGKWAQGQGVRVILRLDVLAPVPDNGVVASSFTARPYFHHRHSQQAADDDDDDDDGQDS